MLFLQPSINPTGGGNAVAVRMIETLLPDYNVTLFAWDRVAYDDIRRYYGGSIKRGDFHVIYAPRWPELLRRLIHVRGALYQRYFMLRWGRRLVGAFDVTISVNNEIDVGDPAIQYVHYPWGKFPRPDLKWFHRIPGVLWLYYAVASLLAPVSDERIRANHTLVNSDWTGQRFRSRYGGVTRTLYPPVSVGEAASLPWEQRKNDFIALGRISTEKRIEMIIEIIERVRARGHHVNLRIVGSVHGSDDYYRSIQRIVATRPWVQLSVNVPREDVSEALAKSRYGIHAMDEEHFGIAIAEMAMSGCIPFVPASGGQMEIVRHDSRLMYDSVDDAVEKIIRVLDDAPLQQQLTTELAENARQFSLEHFQRSFLREVETFLETHRKSPRTRRAPS